MARKVLPAREKLARKTASKKLYSAWRNMIRRCENPDCPDYRFYGAIGIAVSKSWQSFANFARDVGEPPNKDSHISRTNSLKGYFRGNVTWQSPASNLKNSRSVRRIMTAAGEVTLPDAAALVGKHPDSVRQRVSKGMAPAKALIIDKHVQKHVAIKYPQAQELKLSTIRTVAREAGVAYHALRSRIADGLNVADAIHDIRSSTHGKLASDARNNGIRPNTATLRIRNGWSYEAATTLPARARPAR